MSAPIVAVNELAVRWDRRSVVAATMAVSVGAGLVFAIAATLSPIMAALAAILCITAATADAGTINAGLVDASEPERRGAFLAVQAAIGMTWPLPYLRRRAKARFAAVSQGG